jgi:hypothetical protein
MYQHASDDRDRVIADTLGAAIDQWHDDQGDDNGATGRAHVQPHAASDDVDTATSTKWGATAQVSGVAGDRRTA